MLKSSDITEFLRIANKYDVKYIYYRVAEVNYCSGLPYLTRSGYLDQIVEEKSPDGKLTSIIYRIDYSGNSNAEDLCQTLGK